MQQVHWLAFSFLRGLSLLKKHQLLAHFESFDALYACLESKTHSDESVQSVLQDLPPLPLQQATEEMQKLRDAGAWIVSYGDARYPSSLKHMADPPLVLFGRGFLPESEGLFLSVVGTRSPSSYGKRVARDLCQTCVQQGLILVSGLALGIDTLAHQASVSYSKPTLAVLGHGLGQIYPKENQALAREIIKTGCVLTEYSFDMGPQKHHFPQRNRIVAGLSQGLLLVEGAQKSGAGITSRLALEQNKNVYAVPGPIDSPVSYMPNRLISEGAKVVLSAEDILEDYDLPSMQMHADDPSSNANMVLSKEQSMVLQILEREGDMQDEALREHLQLSSKEVFSLLVSLEQSQLIERQLDGSWSKV